MESPQRFSALEIEGSDPAFDGHLVTGRPNDDEILENHWRHRKRLALCRVRNRPFPENPPGLRLQREQVTVTRATNDLARLHGDAAVVRPPFADFRFPLVPPEAPAEHSVEGNRGIGGRYVDDAAINNRVGMKWVSILDPMGTCHA